MTLTKSVFLRLKLCLCLASVSYHRQASTQSCEAISIEYSILLV